MSRSCETIPAIAQTVTDAQIAAAMDRAAALKRRTTLHPEWLCVQPMRAGDALDATARYRYHR
ncbi:MAG TPA: hypothetical protein VHE11_02815, partial [Steroidobacteraceae bacterium]|nr:hypothetical protein [Steroidobacteraceae bacterium]